VLSDRAKFVIKKGQAFQDGHPPKRIYAHPSAIVDYKLFSAGLVADGQRWPNALTNKALPSRNSAATSRPPRRRKSFSSAYTAQPRVP
jgi:hypothetical protein